MDPNTYREFMNGETTDEVVSQRIFAKIDAVDERSEHQRALFETVLIVGMLEIGNDMPHLLTESSTPLLHRYELVVSDSEEARPEDRSISYARSVLLMVQQFRKEALWGTPAGFLHAARRLELLSPDLVGAPESAM